MNIHSSKSLILNQRRWNIQLQYGQVCLQIVGIFSRLRLHVTLQRGEVFRVVPVKIQSSDCGANKSDGGILFNTNKRPRLKNVV